jgi:uncharacterized membrane protein (Fun14 family)
MTATEGATNAPPSRSLLEWFVAMPTWKKVMLGASLTAMVAGGIWSIVTADAVPPTGNGSGGALASGLLPDAPRTESATPEAEPAARGVFRLGFSFVAGFCVGAFLRAMIKVAAIAFGFWLVATMLLSYFELLTVNWQGIDALWNRFALAVELEWSNFQTFMTGSLPAAGLAVTGLAVGMKRH